MQKNSANCAKICQNYCDISNTMEKHGKGIIFMRRNIQVTDNAWEHYGEEGNHAIRKYENTWRKHMKALLYF